MNVILFDENPSAFYPLSLTRPIGALRFGIDTLAEKWQHYLSKRVSFLCPNYLQEKYKCDVDSDNLLINSRVVATEALANQIATLGKGERLVEGDILIAVREHVFLDFDYNSFSVHNYDSYITRVFKYDYVILNHISDIFLKNGWAIEADFERITANLVSHPISSTNTLIGNRVFIEEGAYVEASILNSSTGPIYIGKDAEVMEGSIIRGPFALCEHAATKMAAKIYGPTTIGPHCKVGGELSNVVFQAFSNKGHDGFLGNSVVGEWCNLGADTNSSNLKNNYSPVSLYNAKTEQLEKTNIQFCGLLMGDHSKAGINTMFNTATTVGVCANVFGGDFPPKFIPSFSWGGSEGFETFHLEKSFDVAERMMSRRKIAFDEIEKKLMTHLFSATAHERKWE